MKRTIRSTAARTVAPVLAALDRRLDALAARLEAHTGSVSSGLEQRLDAIEHRIELDLRVVDEHLLAIERASRRATGVAGNVLPLDAGDEPRLVLLVPAGADATIPDGYEAVERHSFERSADGWRPVDRESGAALMVVLLVPKRS